MAAGGLSVGWWVQLQGRVRALTRRGPKGADDIASSKQFSGCYALGHEADRDTNAAACLAQYPQVVYSPKAPASGAWPHVAAKHAETLNVCGEESAGARPVWSVRETVLYEAERTSVQRPRRVVLYETVNTVNTL